MAVWLGGTCCWPVRGLLQVIAVVKGSPGSVRFPRVPQEEAYQRMSALKKAQWEKNNTFYSNRSFSRDIRKVGRALQS